MWGLQSRLYHLSQSLHGISPNMISLFQPRALLKILAMVLVNNTRNMTRRGKVDRAGSLTGWWGASWCDGWG